MDEVYAIEVLHVVNPHVIFVEVRDGAKDLIIEQIGIYGVIPVNQTIDIDGRIVAERCENWPLVATSAIKELVAGNVQTFFMLVQEEYRSTIFNNNSIKFGHILIKTGKQMISLKDHLEKLSIAEQNEDIFHQRLSSGSWKLKLSYVRSEEVLKAIRKYYEMNRRDNDWQEAIDRQTSIFQEAKNIANKLTEKNLKLQQRDNEQTFNVMALIDRKTKDFDLCKDVDEISLGCGARKASKISSKASTDENVESDSASSALEQIKKFLHKSKYHKENIDFVSTYEGPKCDEKYTYDKSENDKFWDKPYEAISKHNKAVEPYAVNEKAVSSVSPVQNKAEYVKVYKYARNEDYLDDSLPHLNQGNSASPPHWTHNKDVKVNKSFDSQKHDSSNLNKSERGASPPNWTPNRTGKVNNSFESQKDNSLNLNKSERDKSITPTKTPERLVAYGPPCSADKVKLKIHKTTYSAPSPYAMKKHKNKDNNCENIITYNEDEVDSNLDFNVRNKSLNLNDDNIKEAKTNEKVFKKESADNTYNSTEDINLNDNKVQHKTNFQREPVNKSYETSKTSLKSDKEKVSDNSENSNEYKMTSKDAVEGSKSSQNSTEPNTTLKDKRLIKLLQRQNVNQDIINSNSDTSVDTSKENDEDIEIIKEKLKTQYKPLEISTKNEKAIENIPKIERNVNPFKNLDGSKSVFVDKLVGPVLMVHTKNDNLILPQPNLRDVPFKTDIRVALKNMNVKEPFRLQTVSWSYILRGHSVFLVGQARGGKSLGYLPAVCNLVMDANKGGSLGPICVIVCATAASVSSIEEHCKRFLGLEEIVLSCYAGVDMTNFMPTLLNGCHILIITAPMLYRLLGTDFGVDLRRLNTLVFEDGERLSEVYASEIKVIVHHVKDMLKNRSDTALKVQYVVASRQWCDFMTPLAKSAPDTVLAIAAFQECVLYSKAPTSVQFVRKDNKINAVIDFLKDIDRSKRTVIVCRTDDEVEAIESVLKKSNNAVFTCNNAMTVHDLYTINVAWDKYEEPVLGPVLICCDGNLTHMNVTNAHYLVHFSMPELFSMFCKRFAVLNENYASIFEPQNQKVKIKILLEECNSEQLPKILNFVKRCTSEEFPMLSEITQQILEKKDIMKAKDLFPVCNGLMMLGECADIWKCGERHAILKDYDEPKPWMPKEGLINFKITFYNSAVTYSARLLSNVTKSGTTKYPNNFNTLSLKMGMYYSKEENRKPQGIIQLGDVCAIAVKPNFFERCQVVKILTYSKGNPHVIRVNLIDEEKLEDTKDVHLFYLPYEFRDIETHVVKVRLANIQPLDKDVTFSALAKTELRKMTENDENLYVRGEVVMTIGNCIFVDTLEACQDLSSVAETVVKYDIKKEMLSRHAEPNLDHIAKLQKLAPPSLTKIETKVEVTPTKIVQRPKWAHLDADDYSTVIFAAATNAGEFFVRLEKFQKVIDSLVNDIQKVVETMEELPKEDIYVGNIVLAQFPNDLTYERARIDVVINDTKVKCFFVDNGDWREVAVNKLRRIPENILHRVPFQAIECRLVGVEPHSDEWTEFSSNWLWDICFEDIQGRTKRLFAKYCTKEQAKVTDGHKYGVIIIDTSSDSDVVINKQMIELNFAKEKESESEFLNRPLDMDSVNITDSPDDDLTNEQTNTDKDLALTTSVRNSNNETFRQILFEKPIRSVPLVNDSDDADSDISINFNNGELMKMFKTATFATNPLENKEFLDSQSVERKAITASLETESDISKDTNSTITLDDTMDKDSDIEIRPDKKKTLTKIRGMIRNSEKTSKIERDSDDLSSATSYEQHNVEVKKTEYPKIIDVTNPPRKPKLIWRQNKSTVSVKIQLIGVDNYSLDIKERSLKFFAYHNDTNYDFEFELYGVVNVKKCRHSSKGQYILVVLQKMLQRNWLNLAKDCTVKNWMSYDVDAIDSSSDEEEVTNPDHINLLKKNFLKEDSDSDDDFQDDADFSYRK